MSNYDKGNLEISDTKGVKKFKIEIKRHNRAFAEEVFRVGKERGIVVPIGQIGQGHIANMILSAELSVLSFSVYEAPGEDGEQISKAVKQNVWLPMLQESVKLTDMVNTFGDNLQKEFDKELVGDLSSF